MRKYNPQRDIDAINLELARIASLKETARTRGWSQVVIIFNRVIGKFMQDVYDKCDKPKKNEIEIKCKKMVADALGSILATLDERVGVEGFLRRQLDEKAAKHADAIKRQQLQQL